MSNKNLLVMDNRFFLVSLVFVSIIALCGIIFLPMVLIGLYIWGVMRSG